MDKKDYLQVKEFAFFNQESSVSIYAQDTRIKTCTHCKWLSRLYRRRLAKDF